MSFPHTSAAIADADVAGAGAADAPGHGSSTLPNSSAAATNTTTAQSKHDAKETEAETSQESGSADKVNSQRTATLPIRTAAAAADHDRDRDPEDGHLIPQSDEKKDNVAKDYRLHATALSYKDFAQPSQTASSTAGVTSTRSSHDAAGDNGNSGQSNDPSSNTNQPSTPRPMISEWSHQAVLLPEPQEDTKKDQKDFFEDDEGWQAMPALGPLDHYDDHGRLVAKAGGEEEDDEAVYQGLGGAGKGYTRVQLDDDDARSATSLEDDTGYLFKEPQSNALGIDNDDDPRDPLSQLQTTKDLLTEGQRIAYVGVTRLMIFHMVQELQKLDYTRSTKKYVAEAIDGLSKWGQKTMIKLYAHMEVSAEEQIMIEQLVHHGVRAADLVPALMRTADVKNPMASSARNSVSTRKNSLASSTTSSRRKHAPKTSEDASEQDPPPPYSAHADNPDYSDKENDDDDMGVPQVRSPSSLATSASSISIDLRWTVLCDLFLVLLSDAVYDSRSRRLLERVGEAMDVSWRKICRFEKRVMDALEMQQQDPKEHWDESDNMERRRKLALKKRYLVMGLATVGGGLVIGLSAGLLAPVIGAGLAAGFTTVGITGTGAFLGGVGGTTLITSGATLAGGTIAIRASDRRTGAVKTFEYRPLHNNKRLNLIITVSGWMTGKVDDVRLPFSTVDPIMGDIYSVLWEPEMLQSIGDTINILATEALTQGLQQVLGSTILVALMSSLQLPLLLTKLAYLIDNPWNVSLDRASAAGLILADSLIDHNLGNRPVTLVGFSLGSRVIFSCLKELANKKALGLVQNVYMFGSPVVANKDEYLKARTAVSGRFVNGYASNDWILGYLFRATSGGIMRVAGLAPVQFPGVENVNVTEFVNGHMAYRTAMPKIMKHMGWEVESEEFAEIEEPDPENHAERQRELIREIDEARRVAKDEPDKKRFGLFKRGRLAKKKEWENYSVGSASAAGASPHLGSPDSRRTSEAGNGNVLFDIDAIRAELAAEHMDVRELQSTLPPMKLDLDAPQQLLSPQRAATTPDGLGVKNKEKEDVKEDTHGGRRRSTLTAAPSMTSLTPRGGLYDYDEEADADHTFSFSPVQGASKSPWDDPSPGHQHDDEVQLTFDTAFDEHHHDLDFPDAGGHGLDDVQLTFDTAFADEPGHGQAHDPGPDPFTSPPQRTSLHDDVPAKSSTTGLGLSGAGDIDNTGMASLDTVSPTKNVWAEEEDDLFGSGGRHGHDDGEIHMTFE